MTPTHRRRFFKQLGLGFTGTVLFPHLIHDTNAQEPMVEHSLPFDDSESFWESIKSQFKFEKGLYYFNNASLGSSPLAVQSSTNQYRATLDSFPSKYMWSAWHDDKEVVRSLIANFFCVSPEEIAIIHNTTEGMNLIARSFDLEAGDEIILASHEHASGTVPWEVWQERQGIKLVRPKVPLLPESKEELIDVYRKAITPKTKVISMCHVVNTNGMIFPVKEVSEMAQKKGIKVAVDGAQSAGMFKIDLNELGCDYFTASAHKWLFAPKGIGVFYAKKESQALLKPLIVARGHNDQTIRRLENYNTRNLPEYLGFGEAINFLNQIGIEKIQQRSFELKSYFRTQVAKNPKLILKSPQSDDLSCAIQTLEIKGMDVKTVKNELFESYGIDTRPMSTFGLNGCRISLGIYITKKDIDYLITALNTISA